MKFKTKYLHIAVIILGIIFLSICAFHTTLWFDESYSVAIAKHNFADIWNITGNDVHPPLYYWALHIIFLIFGNNILAFRLFSVLATVLLGIVGFTHIRKDFGEKTGILFSFLMFFLPVMTAYSQEIRMYSWSCLLVTLTAIYAYRFYKSIKEKSLKSKNKNLIVFGIFSICCCYIHYYALVTTGLINLFLLIYLIKNRKEEKNTLIHFLILAGIHIVLYIPWLMFFMGQIKHVSNGFWIALDPVSTPVELLSFQFRRQLDTNFVWDAHTIIAIVSAVLMYIYLGFRAYKCKKDKQELRPAVLSFAIYASVIVAMFIITIIIWRPIFFSRYLFVVTGLYVFTLAFIMSTEKNKFITLGICAVIVVLGTISNITNTKMHYNKGNTEVYDYLRENMQEGDIIVYSDIGVRWSCIISISKI